MIARYARVVDDRDVDGIVGLFTEDGRIDFEGGEQSGVGHEGIRRVRDGVRLAAHGGFQASTHLMGNTLMTIDGDGAHAETDAVAFIASSTTVVTAGALQRRPGSGVGRMADRQPSASQHLAVGVTGPSPRTARRRMVCVRPQGSAVPGVRPARPPSTTIVEPVTYDAAGEHRNRTTSATSSARAGRRSGVQAMACDKRPGAAAVIAGSATAARATQLTRIPAGANRRPSRGSARRALPSTPSRTARADCPATRRPIRDGRSTNRLPHRRGRAAPGTPWTPRQGPAHSCARPLPRRSSSSREIPSNRCRSGS